MKKVLNVGGNSKVIPLPPSMPDGSTICSTSTRPASRTSSAMPVNWRPWSRNNMTQSTARTTWSTTIGMTW